MKKPTVAVVMSTYNGEKYLNEQIRSIMEQTDVNTMLTVRDDGSKDGTVAVLRNLQKDYPDRITVFAEENVGYQKSFLKLLLLCRDADFYAFSDQDDIWQPEKLLKAIERLENQQDVLLYASGVNEVDESLRPLYVNDISNMDSTLESYFTRSRLAGCTFVFTNKLRDYVKWYLPKVLEEEFPPDHDNLVASCAFAFGKVYLDRNSYILHRRHAQSVTNGGGRIWKRIKTEMSIIFKRKGNRSRMAAALLSNGYATIVDAESKRFLIDVVNNRKSWKHRLRLLFNKRATSHMLVCDIAAKLKILLGNY